MIYFSEDENFFQPRCESCHRITKVPKGMCNASTTGYNLNAPHICGCGEASSVIKGNNEISKTNYNEGNAFKTLIFILVIFCSLIYGVYHITHRLGSNNSQASTSSSYSPTDGDVWVVAIHAVQNSLKAPSTAKFPNYNNATIKSVGSNKWHVESYVDAQNGFGAMIRSNFSVDVSIDSSGYGTATNIKIDQ